MPTMSVCIGNHGYYAEGELHDAWLELPIEPCEIRPWLIKHHLWDQQHEENYVSDYDGVPLGCTYGGVFSEYTPLHRLNTLAQLMDMLPLECDTVTSFIETSGEEPDDVLGLCNWLLQADDLPYYDYDVPDYCKNDSPEGKYGYQLARYSGWWETLEANGVSDHFDLEGFGREWSANVCLGDDGYVDCTCDFPDQDRYDWDDIEGMMPWGQHAE